jgi:hypothetical protein
VIKQNAIPLIELLLLSAIDGPLPLRINAITTITKIFQLLTFDTVNDYSDENRLLIKILTFIKQKSYFSILLSRIMSIQQNDLKNQEQVSLFLMTLQLFHRILLINQGRMGITLLSEIGVIEQLCCSDFFSFLLNQLIIVFTSNSSGKGSVVVDGYYSMINEILSFLIVFLSSLSSSCTSSTSLDNSSSSMMIDKQFIKYVIMFYQQNRESFTQFLHLSLSTLIQLEFVEKLTSFFMIFYSRCLSYFQTDNETSTEERYLSNYSKLWKFLSKDLDIILMDCFYLLQSIGKKLCFLVSLFLSFIPCFLSFLFFYILFFLLSFRCSAITVVIY